KITGRTANGLQVGILDAVTSAENARVITAAGEAMTPEVEPLTNYLVARVKQTSRGGNLRYGAIATSTLRRFGNDELRGMLPARAPAAGVDFAIRSPAETHSLGTHFAVSEVTGASDVIQRRQRSSARYFDRPDREPGGNGVFSDAWDANARS